MNAAQTNFLSYADLRKQQRTHMLRQSEIPVEHAISLPIPTRRWGGPGYTFFASPAVRMRGQPMEQGVPDRWWVVDAQGGRLILYALWKVLPFAEGTNWTSITLPPPNRSISELQAAEVGIETLMDAGTISFFANEPGVASTRKALAEALAAHLAPSLVPQYHALAPDFFAWLST